MGEPMSGQSKFGMTHLQQRVKMPALVGRKALHKGSNFGSQVWLEVCVSHLEVVQELFRQRLDVALVHQRIHQIQCSPAAQESLLRLKLH